MVLSIEGKDYKYIDGVRYTSQEHLGSVEYKSQKQAQAELPYVYEKIRQKYGQ